MGARPESLTGQRAPERIREHPAVVVTYNWATLFLRQKRLIIYERATNFEIMDTQERRDDEPGAARCRQRQKLWRKSPEPIFPSCLRVVNKPRGDHSRFLWLPETAGTL
jgi:hypothetical protein